MRFVLVICAALMALSAAPAAMAQDFQAQVRSYLDRGMAVHSARGYRRDSAVQDVITPLRIGDARLIVLNVQGGQNYRIYGACDQDCSDVDMEVYDSDGNLVERDIGYDDTPFVQITPRASGRIYARIWLAACENEPCVVGVRVLRGGEPEVRQGEGVSGPTADGGDYARGIESLLEQAGAGFAREGFMPLTGGPATPIAPVLIESEGQTITYNLIANRTYRFAAACDSDCSDLDIEVRDSGGRQVASNVAVDNPTTVDVTPRASGAFAVRIWLATCNVEPCYVGQRAFIRNGR